MDETGLITLTNFKHLLCSLSFSNNVLVTSALAPKVFIINRISDIVNRVNAIQKPTSKRLVRSSITPQNLSGLT
jgi:hypothetical protein